jgi:hypothetical protein
MSGQRATTKRVSTETPALLIPRFVQDLNVIAERVGLSVLVAAADGKLVATWRGSKKQMRATGLLTPGYRFPYGRCPFKNTMIEGSMIVERRGVVRAEVYCGEIPNKIEHKGDIEVIHYKNETAYHGPREALIAGHVCEEKQFPGPKHRRRQSHGWSEPEPNWEAHLMPSGMYLFARETDQAAKERAAKWAEYKRQNEPGSLKDSRADYQSPEEWLERIEDDVCIFARAVLSEKFASVVTKSGMRYSANTERFTEILNSIEVAAQQIRDVPVRVEALAQESTPDAREKATSASADALFQRFMQTAMVMPQEPDGKQARQ